LRDHLCRTAPEDRRAENASGQQTKHIPANPQVRGHKDAVKRAEEYRRHADECRMLARGAATAEDREQILAMAETWEKLAFEWLRIQARTNQNLEFDRKAVSNAPKE
jgi:hypothetical protein